VFGGQNGWKPFIINNFMQPDQFTLIRVLSFGINSVSKKEDGERRIEE
jgi:hypothetical protein